LQDIPGLLGKTGTAEYIDNTHAHGWFVGIDGDLALAVFVSDAGSSGPAVDAAGRFLRAQKEVCSPTAVGEHPRIALHGSRIYSTNANQLINARYVPRVCSYYR